MKTSLRASLEGRSSGNSPNVTEQVAFRFHDLEITSKALVMHFFEEKTVIPLKKITSFHLKWCLHDPIFAKKYWFLELTVHLQNGEEQSTTAIGREIQLPQRRARKTATHPDQNCERYKLGALVTSRGAIAQKMNCF